MRRTLSGKGIPGSARPPDRDGTAAPPGENTSIRVTFSGKSCLLPQIAMLGWSRFSKAQPRALAAHQHHGCWEICYLVRGNVDWWAGEDKAALHAGDVYITPPDQPHGGADAVMQPCELYWVQVAISANRAWPGLSVAETRGIVAGLTALNRPCFPGSPRVAELFQRLIEEHQHPPRDPHAAMLVRAAMHELLVQVLRDHGEHHGKESRRPYSAQIATVIKAMEEQPGEGVSLPEMAARAGWSVSHFCQRFTHETGLTPTEYRNHQRVRRAKILLDRPSGGITAIAMELGFSSSQYFATVFRQITGMTPRAYRRRAAQERTR